MAARSEGIFPREGFNLDNMFAMFAFLTDAPVTLKNIASFRVIITGVTFTPPVGDGGAATISYTLGDKTYVLTEADFIDGTYIAHHRGYSLGGTNSTRYTITDGADNTGTGGTASVGRAAIELVDGPAH